MLLHPSHRTAHRTVPILFACAASLALHGCWWDDSATNPPPPSAAPAPAPASYTVGGGITGLTAAGLVLANGSDTLSVAATATGFTLPTPVADGSSYAVTVTTQPAGLHCSLSGATGTVGGANVTSVAVACAPASHTLGGTIAGLPSSGLVLSNGTDTVSPAAGALAFTFATPVAEGGAFAVAVTAQPTGATCSVGSGSGTMGNSDVSSVQVTCAANAYHLSGTISGLTASGLILANGTDTVSPSANATSFAFAQPVAFGGSYSVTVRQQPTGQTCSVGGTYPATMGAGDVTNLAVSCTAVSGLSVVVGQTICPIPSRVDGNGASASVPQAEGLVFDRNGNLFVAGSGSKAVQRITPAGDVTTLAGSGLSGTADGTGSNASFDFPQGIALDSAGNLYISDYYAIRYVTQAGVVTTLAGSANAPGRTDATGTAARFNQTKSIVTDTTGNAYIADSANNVIRKMTPAGVVTTFAGGGSAGGTTAGFADGSGTAALFSAPIGLAIDAAGNLYVADYLNWAIRKITPAGVVSTLAGGGPSNPGLADGTGSAARFGGTTDLALGAGGNLYVLDQSFAAIRLVSPSGVVTTLAADPRAATGAISAPAFAMPTGQTTGIGADRSGALYLSAGCAIQKFGP